MVFDVRDRMGPPPLSEARDFIGEHLARLEGERRAEEIADRERRPPPPVDEEQQFRASDKKKKKKGRARMRTENKPDTDLYSSCGFLSYNPFEKSAGGAGPNMARNSKASDDSKDGFIYSAAAVKEEKDDKDVEEEGTGAVVKKDKPESGEENEQENLIVVDMSGNGTSFEADSGEEDGQESMEILTDRAEPRNRIVNGEKVSKNRPWIVAIYRGIGYKGAKPEYICTGALLTRTHLVTAAHCICVPPSKNPIKKHWTNCKKKGPKTVNSKHMAFYSFFPGLVRLDKKKPKDQIKAKVITIHPDHTVKKETSDICVIELKTKMKISETIKPICLPAKEPELDLGLNEVFSAGWGTNAVQANLDDNPPKHKSCMTTQFGSVAFKGCVFDKENEGCYKKKDPPQDSRCPAIVTAVTKQHSRLDKILVYWGSGENTTRCYLPKVHGDHGWCKTNGGDWGFCYSSCNEKATSPVQKTKELREVSFSRLNNTLCQSATPTFDSSIELCMGHILREPIVGILTTDEDDGDNAKDRKKKKKQSNRLLLRKITKQSYTGNDPVGLRDTCQGDSGGPYYQYRRDPSSSSGRFRGILVGVTSRGSGCAQLGHAGTVTNVFHFVPWIKKIIKDSKKKGGKDGEADEVDEDEGGGSNSHSAMGFGHSSNLAGFKFLQNEGGGPPPETHPELMEIPPPSKDFPRPFPEDFRPAFPGPPPPPLSVVDPPPHHSEVPLHPPFSGPGPQDRPPPHFQGREGPMPPLHRRRRSWTN